MDIGGVLQIINGEEIWPAPNRVLKTCGTRDGMGIDTSPHRQMST